MARSSIRMAWGFVALVGCGGASAPAAAPTLSAAPAPPPISLDFLREMAQSRNFTLGEPRRITPTDDGRFVFFLRPTANDSRNSLWETTVATGATRELLRPETLVGKPEKVSAEEQARLDRQRIGGSGITSFEATGDGSVIVVGLSGKLYVWTRATGKSRELPVGAGAFDPHLSPDGKTLAYARNHDVYAISIAVERGQEYALTFGGTETHPHGVAEFMAEEEFCRSRGFWWSPDGNEMLYEDAELSGLPQWTLADPGRPDQPPQTVAYPKAGERPAKVGLVIASTAGRLVHLPIKVIWDAEQYPYLATAAWPKNAPPTLTVLNRAQNRAAVLAVDPSTGATRVLHTEEDPVWLKGDPTVPRWLPDGSGFLWSTEKNGAWELDLHDKNGKKIATVMPPRLGYYRVLAVDAPKRTVYVSTLTDRSEVWAASLDGGEPKSLSRNTEGIYRASFGNNANVHGFTEATPRGVRRFGIRSVDGKVDIAVASAAKPPPFLPRLEITKIGKEDFRVAMIRPRQFNPARRYPVIDNIYGMPWANMVSGDGLRYVEEQWLADTVDAIVVMIDARGSEGRDRAWSRAFRHRIDDLSVEGHAQTIAELAKKYPEIDVKRVGIYGWAGGGYNTAMAILRRPDFYKVGVSGAPMVDLADYDAVMDRFLGTPPNPDWEKASLLTWASRPPTAASPRRPLLLIHGTADDNVYLVHSLKLAEAMGRAGRPVEFMPLIGQTHAISDPDAMAAIWKRTAEYFREHL